MNRTIRDGLMRIGQTAFSEELLLRLRFEIVVLAARGKAWVSPAQRRIRKQLQARRGLRVDVGAGPFDRAGWISIDAQFHPDVLADVSRGLPLADGSASMVFIEHVFEHLQHPGQTRLFLSEAYRVLEPGGHLRVIVPDAEKVIRAYADGDQSLLQDLASTDEPLTPIEVVNKLFRERASHQFAWDYAHLERELVHAGFEDVRRAGWRDSPIEELNIDLDEAPRRRQSLYVEATRPETSMSAGTEPSRVRRRTSRSEHAPAS